jgi:hypothetical protein
MQKKSKEVEESPGERSLLVEKVDAILTGAESKKLRSVRLTDTVILYIHDSTNPIMVNWGVFLVAEKLADKPIKLVRMRVVMKVVKLLN